KRNGIFGPFHDVDLFAAQFTNDRLHARALHADAGSDRIHIALAREHGDLRAIAGLADRASDHHRPVVDFRYFLFEELDQQRRVGARQHDLWTLRAAVDTLDDRSHPVLRRIAFRARLLFTRQHGLDA